MELVFSSKLWEWPGKAAWCFVTLPNEVSTDIRDLHGSQNGFVSIRAEATIGIITWRTSIFPDSTSGSYLLPIKRDVRKLESITIGDIVPVQLRLIVLDP